MYANRRCSEFLFIIWVDNDPDVVRNGCHGVDGGQPTDVVGHDKLSLSDIETWFTCMRSDYYSSLLKLLNWKRYRLLTAA